MTRKPLIGLFWLTAISRIACAQVGDSCTMAVTGDPGVCKLSTACPAAEQQAQNGISPTICGYDRPNMPIVCCEGGGGGGGGGDFSLEPNDNTFLDHENPPAVIDSFVYPTDEDAASTAATKSEQKCLEYTKATTATVLALPLVTNTEPISLNIAKCDYNGVALIVGGKPALAGEFPFMAAIGFHVANDIEWRCGGTLISDKYVLTAAHCSTSRDVAAPETVRLGDLDLTSTNDNTVHMDYGIKRIVVHPRYRYPQKYNDIALIQVVGRVKFTTYIRPACLHTKSSIDQDAAIATGWGKTDYAAPETSNKLMKVSLNVYDNNRCSQVYGRNKNLPDGIKSNMVCAGELKGGMDTCQGDSGGPLLITKKGNQCIFYIVGVTSFGKSCGQANIPAVYTKVSEFVPWIEKTIW